MELMESIEAPVEGTARVSCCRCGIVIKPNPSNMCVACLRSEVDITEGISKQATLHYCRGCERYLQPPSEWIVAPLGSPELLSLCLKKVKGLQRVKFVDAGFVWTEEHSKRLRVKITVEAEVVDGAVLEQVFIVDFTTHNQMCNSCHRTEAKDYWRASVQVRQKSVNRKTFYYLEQLVLKHGAQAQALAINPVHEGADFYYANEAAARKMIDFLVALLPCRYQHSKKLISHDIHSNIYNYKFTFSVEIVPISKGSVVCLPKKLTQQLGGINPIALVYKATNALHLMDVSTGQVAEVSATVYWRYPFNSICNPKQLTEYIVMDIESIQEKDLNVFPGQGSISSKHAIADAWLIRANELGISNNLIHTRTHLGHILKPGDSALGYAIGDSNINDANYEKLNQDSVPDVILVKKYYGSDKTARRRARLWKLKRLGEGELVSCSTDNNEYNEFLDELEEDAEMRQNVNIFRDSSKKRSVGSSDVDPTMPQIGLDEMLDDLAMLDLNDQEMSEIHE